MTLPSPALQGRQPHVFVAAASLLLSLIFPLGFVLFILQLVVDSHPALASMPIPALNLILHGVTSVILVLGLPATGVAIALGHVALGQVSQAPLAVGTRRVARTGLALGYLSALVALLSIGFTVFRLGTQSMHLVW